MNFKTYLKMYAVPFAIISVGFIFYFFVFDSLNQYQQQSIITILENRDKDNGLSLEQIHMQEELNKIRKSANATFIQNTISENLDRINSNVNIEFNDNETTQQKPQTIDTNKEKSMQKTKVKKYNEIKYTPYNPANTHIIPNNFSVNPNSPTNINLDSESHIFDIQYFTLFLNAKALKWATPYSRHAKIYRYPSISSKIIYTNKKMDKVQIIGIKKSWVKVRYAIKGKKQIEGYMPTNALNFRRI